MKHEKNIVTKFEKLFQTLNEFYKVIFEKIKNAETTSQQITNEAMK